MKSDVIVKQFIDLVGKHTNPDLQHYLDGQNEWEAPIMEADIIQLNYNLSSIGNESMARKFPTTGILLLHRIPKK